MHAFLAVAKLLVYIVILRVVVQAQQSIVVAPLELSSIFHCAQVCLAERKIHETK